VGERARSHRRLSQPIALERSPFREEDEGGGGGEETVSTTTGEKQLFMPRAPFSTAFSAHRSPEDPVYRPPAPGAKLSPSPSPARQSAGCSAIDDSGCVASRFTFGKRSGISVEADRERAARLSEISNEVDISWEIYCPALMADPINGNLPRFPGTPSPPLTATVR